MKYEIKNLQNGFQWTKNPSFERGEKKRIFFDTKDFEDDRENKVFPKVVWDFFKSIEEGKYWWNDWKGYNGGFSRFQWLSWK